MKISFFAPLWRWLRIGTQNRLNASVDWAREQYSSWFQPVRLGSQGERAAAKYLRRKRIRIVGHSVEDFLGEIDLVAVDGRSIVFIEVKTRSSEQKGSPDTAIDQEKQWRLTRLALAFMSQHDLLEEKARFDTVSVIWSAGAKRPEKIEHIRNAFTPTGHDSMFS